MQDNVRVGRQSLTKKISFHQKQKKPYRTIDSLEKAPTRKKINLQEYPLKKESHPYLTSSSKHPERKIKSLTKNELRRPSQPKKRSVMGSDPDLATLQTYANRNKYSLSRDRLGQNRQKYKRSEQVRSVIEQKKFSNFSKIDRKQTEPNPRLSQIYSSISVQKKNYPQRLESSFLDLNLESLINTSEGQQHQVTLQDVFQSGCLLFYQYLKVKEQKMAHTNNLKTYDLKSIKEQLTNYLEQALQKFTIILKEAGEMSVKNIVMLGLVKYEQKKNNEAIMYLSKALDKSRNNLMLVELPGPDLAPNRTLTELSTGQPKPSKTKQCHLNLAAYLALADSYKNTQNYLCAINTLLKWEDIFHESPKKIPSPIVLKTHYQTLGSEEIQIRSRMKKKSYIFQSQLQEDATRNKLKKYSQASNRVNMDMSKSNKNIFVGSDRPKSQLVELDDSDLNMRTLQSGQENTSFLNYSEHQGNKQYEKQSNEIFLLLARLYLSIKNYQMAIKYYKKCLEWNPRRVEAILQLASLLYHQRQGQKCLHWLDTALNLFLKLQPNEQIELDISYIKYHKSLVLLQEGQLQQSYQLLQEIQIKELWSEVNYYKGYILVQQLESEAASETKTNKIQRVLMFFKQSIASFTSRQYLIKSYFQILLIMVFEKKDYYGAQYEVNRFKKLIPRKQESKDEEEGRASRISKLFCEDQAEEERKRKSLSINEDYFTLLMNIIQAVICILKMKISRGLATLKELSFKLQNQVQQISQHYGHYYRQILKIILQFKFYCYYIQRQYQLSLKHINKLIILEQQEVKKGEPQGKDSLTTDLTLLGLNRMMLECMILMRQGKFNYAMSKLTEIDDQLNHPEHPINGALILNNFYMVKSLCYINLYTQLQNQKAPNEDHQNHEQSLENNKEILLSAQELLRHCLISDKENSLIYYLISAIHYELEEYQSSLKYIREALEYSDDHMIKHYFCKANTKTMLGRYDESIKDYTNAVIVYKEQLKNQTPSKTNKKDSKIVNSQQDLEQYYSEKQIMFKEIYLNRAIAYLKEAYALSRNKHYSQNVNVILSYRIKATEDLLTYFEAVQLSNIDLSTDKTLRNRLLLFLHSDDPSHMFQISKKISPRLKIIHPEDCIKGYYLVKQLNNCISNMKTYLKHLQTKYNEKEELKQKKDSLGSKHKKISMALPKKSSAAPSPQKIMKLHFDVTCLEALKLSSNKTQEALQEALISLLELTEEVYRNREKEAGKSREMEGNHTLEQIFLDHCGEIFRWSDILFFIGVIHFEMKEYDTAIKYLQQSYNQKRLSNSLYSLQKYLYPILSKSHSETSEESTEDQLFSQLQPLFENRIYCKEQLEYNLGICYLMQKKYKQAYFYLQNYPLFLNIIKKEIVLDNFILQENQFMNQEMEEEKKSRKKTLKNSHQIRIEESGDSEVESSVRDSLHRESRQNIKKRQIERMSKNERSQDEAEEDEEAEGSLQQGDMIQNITPFPTRNRLCSIYPPKAIDDKQFYLSFCLPKIQLPLLGIFQAQQIDVSHLYQNESQKQDSFESQTSVFKEESQINRNKYKIDKKEFESVIGHISLLDLQMKPIAPWIKQNSNGVIFTETLVNESVDLNSERTEKKDKKDGKKGKNQRYAQNNLASE